MTDKFKNRYRIASARAPFWDYGWNAVYFVTICTQDRTHYFGDVRNGSVYLSKIGEIADYCWLQIPQHFPFVKLDVHIVMPNHVHGIVIIDKPDDGRGGGDDGQRNDGHDDDYNNGCHNVETQNFASLSPTTPSSTTALPKNRFGPQSQNLASIIRGFKTGVTKNARKTKTDFTWQPRFHDRIIRNQGEYRRISNYIVNNPLKWREDSFYNR